MQPTLWLLLGYDNNGNPTYCCPVCYLVRYTLVTPGAKLPDYCYKCMIKSIHES